MYKKIHIHFIGIGGIGMSGIAQILKNQGYAISGCDIDHDQQSIKDLKKIGCSIFMGNNTPDCRTINPDVIVYSSAIRAHNPEIIAAQAQGIPTISRAMMLSELMRTKFSIAIAGSHGKTTTTSLISHILIEAQKDPTVIIGGHLKNIQANARLGNGEFLVAEADESDRSLQNLQATLAIITNINLEHLDTYKDLDDIKETFKRFLNNIPFYGKAFICIDDPQVRSLLPIPHIRTIKYGIEHEADLGAKNIALEAEQTSFDIVQKGISLGRVHTIMLGRHNVQNILAATAVCLELGVSFETIAHAIRNFKGIERRFSFKGTFQGAEIFDDYGHHPREIYNTLLVAKKRARRRLIVLFQPHRYSRTDKLWNDFIKVFLESGIDHLLITDIYPASEAPIAGVTSQKLVADMQSRASTVNIDYVPFEQHFESINQQLKKITQENDLILLLGAGKINKFALNN